MIFLSRNKSEIRFMGCSQPFCCNLELVAQSQWALLLVWPITCSTGADAGAVPWSQTEGRGLPLTLNSALQTLRGCEGIWVSGMKNHCLTCVLPHTAVSSFCWQIRAFTVTNRKERSDSSYSVMLRYYVGRIGRMKNYIGRGKWSFSQSTQGKGKTALASLLMCMPTGAYQDAYLSLQDGV